MSDAVAHHHHHPHPAHPRASARRVLGVQPVLLVGIVLLTIVALVTIVLVFVGDIETQTPRVVATVIAFVAFTGLLAIDLGLARRSSVPLVIGVSANAYLLAVLMLATWVDASGADRTSLTGFEPPLEVRLSGVFLLAVVVVRIAAAGSWALVALGRRGVHPIARVSGVIAAALLGLTSVLLTLHLAITPFGVEVGEAYWRLAVASVVLAALAACITTLLAWSRRQLDAPAHVPQPVQPPLVQQQQQWPAPQQPQGWPHPHPQHWAPPHDGRM